MNHSQAGRSADKAARQYRGQDRLLPSRTSSAGSLRSQFPPQASKLHSGFFAVRREAAERIRHCSRSEMLLWLYTCLNTSGFSREWHKLDLAEARNWCQLRKSAFHKAKSSLQDQGIIELSCDRYGHPHVRLCPDLQPFTREYLSTRFSPFASDLVDLESVNSDCESIFVDSQRPSHEGSKPDGTELSATCGSGPKETVKRKEIKEQQQNRELDPVFGSKDGNELSEGDVRELGQASAQAALGEAPLSVASGSMGIVKSQATAAGVPAQADGAEPKLSVRTRAEGTLPYAQGSGKVPPALSAEQQANLDVLRGHGVGAPMDLQLARSKSTAAVARAVVDLRHACERGSVRNAAAWLVQALQSGRCDQERPREVEGMRSTVLPSQPRERERALAEVTRRQQEQDLAFRARLDAETAAQVAELNALEPSRLARLRARAESRFQGRSLPEGAIVGMMLSLYEMERRQAAS